MQDPLIPPLAAIATGILASRFVSFETRELFIVMAAFATLGAIALWRRARVLAGACCLLGFVFAGALVDLAHRPGPWPELDAEGREPVILSGCVVQPPALSGDRERFVVDSAGGWTPRMRTKASRHPRSITASAWSSRRASAGRVISAIPARSTTPAFWRAARSIGPPP